MSFDKNIILDFDGTLIDTERVMLRCCRDVAVSHGLEYDQASMDRFVGESPQHILAMLMEQFGPSFDALSFVAEAVEIYDGRLKRDLAPLMEGARDLLEFLKADGWRVGLATTTQESVALYEIRAHGIEDFFERIVTGDMVEESKPSPEIYLRICAAMNVSPDNCFAAEDSTVGIASALAAGMKTIAVPDLHDVSPETAARCVAVVRGCRGVISFLRSLEGR